MTSPLSPLTAQWFHSRFGSPTAVQEGTWQAAAEGKHLLAVAPTGSGKTLAAFLVALDRLVNRQEEAPGLKVLYISPLKALGRDVRENLGAPLRELQALYAEAGRPFREVRAGIRNGDTTPSERRWQVTRPPEILITTPESLGILLLSESGRAMLSTVETCIVDEIHAMAPNRRGTLLACHLERLADLAGEFRRIGLTATVNPVERAAAFLGGAAPADNNGMPVPRPVEVIAPPVEKKISITVEPLPSRAEKDIPEQDGFWRDIADRIRDGLGDKRATLAFIDSRKWSEKVARLINEGSDSPEPLAWAHHGSLSKDMRRLVETRLKEGKLKTVVATGSLELGIDIGPLDEVLLMGSPSSPSRALQRAGRAGHRPGEESRARIFPIHPPDMLAAAVLARMAVEGRIENLLIPENPLDILAQVIVALCCEQGRSEEEIWNLVRRAWCFRNLPRESFDRVLSMLRGRYAETRLQALRPVLYSDSGRLVARPGMKMRLYSGGGAIPDLGNYGVKQQGVDGRIGALDEKFVWESQAGMVFHLGNRRWKITSIGDKDVIVVPTDEPENTEPFWRAEGGSRDPEFASRISDLLEGSERCLSGDDSRNLEAMLEEDYGLPGEQADQLGAWLRDQRRRTGCALPHRGHLVAEAAADPEADDAPGSRSLFLHTFLGGRINRPLALALQAAWAEKSPVPVTPTVTDDTIAFTINEKDLDEILSVLRSLGEPEGLIRRVLEATPFFGGKFREAAGRALLLPASNPRHRQPLWMTRQRSRALMEAVAGYPDFPIMAEVWRTCLNDEFAMDGLNAFLDDLRDGTVTVTAVRTPAPSPFAGTAVRRRLSRRMTANMRDQADSRLVSRLGTDEIRRLSRAGALRPRIPESLAAKLDSRRRRVEEGYAPSTVEALKAWVAEREAFDEGDWSGLLDAVSAESGKTRKELESALSGSVRGALLGPEGASWRIAADAVDDWEKAFPAGEETIDTEAAGALAAFWLSGRGPVPVEEMVRRFGIAEGSGAAASFLGALEDADSITVDHITDLPGDAPEAADSEGLEILLRWRRRQGRNREEPLPASRLAGFLAWRQGMGTAAPGEEGIRDILAGLEGIPLAAASWEQAVLPSRIPGYRSRDLDSLAGREEVLWVGSGKGKIAWLTAEGGWRYPAPAFGSALAGSAGSAGSADSVNPRGSGVSEESGVPGDPFPGPGDAPRDFWTIADALGTDSAAAVEILWNRVWEGRLTCADTSILRRGISSGFRAEKAADRGRARPGGLRGWQAGRPVSGRWYAPAYAEAPEDPFAADALMREQVRLLASRYGILSRPLLEREIPPWRWSALSRTLGLMELGDELIGGRWFEGLPMPQFMAPEAVHFWREGAVSGRPWCIEATDPASPCGIAPDDSLPARRAGTWLGWDENGEQACTLTGRDLRLAGAGKRLGKPLEMIASIITEREAGPRNRLAVSRVNGTEIGGKYEEVLEQAGFVPAGNGDWVRRARPIGMRD